MVLCEDGPSKRRPSRVQVASVCPRGSCLPSVPSGGQKCGGGGLANPAKGSDLRCHVVCTHVAPADETLRPGP